MEERFMEYINSLRSSGVQLINTVTIPIDGVEQINVAYLGESIILRHSSSDSVVLHEYLELNAKQLCAVVERKNNQIYIQHGNRSLIPVCGFIELYIPQWMEGICTIKTLSGSIYSKDNWSMSAFSGHTISGNILIQSLSADIVNLTSDIGDITLGRIAGQIDLQTSRGSVLMQQVLGCGKIQTKVGDIEAHIFAANGSFEITSSKGNINVYLPPDHVIEVEARTDLGRIDACQNSIVGASNRNTREYWSKKTQRNIRIISEIGDISIREPQLE